ncbi:MAG: carbohydrate ABC transporter permease [Acidimicrobiales bacterium]
MIAADVALPELVAPALARRRPSGLRWLRHLAAIAICLVMAFPVYWMLVTALQPESDLTAGVANFFPTHLDFGNFGAALRAQPWGHWFLNTILVSAASVVLSVSTSVLAGYAFAKLRFWGKSFVFVAILCTLIMPVQVVIVPQFRITVDLHMFDSLWGVIIPEVAYPFGVFLSRQYMLSIPNELLEAARVDGAGALRTFTKAVLPLCKPLIAVLVLFNVVYRWSDFAWPLIVLKSPANYTITVGLLYLQGEYTVNYAQMLGMALLTVLPMLLLFVLLQRYFVQGLLRSGIR